MCGVVRQKRAHARLGSSHQPFVVYDSERGAGPARARHDLHRRTGDRLRAQLCRLSLGTGLHGTPDLGRVETAEGNGRHLGGGRGHVRDRDHDPVEIPIEADPGLCLGLGEALLDALADLLLGLFQFLGRLLGLARDLAAGDLPVAGTREEALGVEAADQCRVGRQRQRSTGERSNVGRLAMVLEVPPRPAAAADEEGEKHQDQDHGHDSLGHFPSCARGSAIDWAESATFLGRSGVVRVGCDRGSRPSVRRPGRSRSAGGRCRPGPEPRR